MSTHLRFVPLLSSLSAILRLGTAGTAQAQNIDDAHGKEWRQLTDTAGLTWTQLASACPQDGQSACSGSVDNLSLESWVWATDAQVLELFSYYVPTMPPSRVVSGFQYFFAAQTFPFRPTFSFCLTYSCGNSWGGWTATLDEAGLPIAGSVGWQTGGVAMASASFGVGPVANPDEAQNWRGAWLWRATGPGVHAYDDAGLVASPAGGTAVESVLANDWIARSRATVDNVVLTQVSSTDPGVALDPVDGSVDAASGTPPGIHRLVYRICDPANPSDCSSATVTVTVKPYVIVATSDDGGASPATGGVAIRNVLANDTLGGVQATSDTVSLSLLSAPVAGITLDTTTGAVRVAPDTALGTSILSYEVCELANPDNCARATATVSVRQNPIRANDDSFSGSSKTGGFVGNVLSNDTLLGAPATPATVHLTVISTTPATTGFELDLTSGAILVVPKATSGTFALVYEICEIASPSNCSRATATIQLSGRTTGSPMTVTHPTSVTQGSNLTVKVEDASGPIHQAVVEVTGPSALFLRGLTNLLGTLDVSTTDAHAGDELIVTVTDSNHIPYQGKVLIEGASNTFVRADANGDRRLDISDALTILNYLFLGAAAPTCLDAADANDDGDLDVADGIRVLLYLFAGLALPPGTTPGSPQTDPTPDSLGCAG